MWRMLFILAALTLPLVPSSQAAVFVASPPSLPPPSENASTAFWPNESESRIGLLCHNDPVNRTDPDGLYGRGDGFTDKQWDQFNRAQQAAAGRLEKASAKMDAKAFEKAFGKGSATPENMGKVQQTMQKMAGALRDDGSKGYMASGVSAAEIARQGYNPATTFGIGKIGGKTIEANLDHRSYGNNSSLSWMAGHESGHNAGLGHGMLNGVTAYKYGDPGQREAYKNLPSADRLGNPDNYMDFAR